MSAQHNTEIIQNRSCANRQQKWNLSQFRC